MWCDVSIFVESLPQLLVLLMMHRLGVSSKLVQSHCWVPVLILVLDMCMQVEAVLFYRFATF